MDVMQWSQRRKGREEEALNLKHEIRTEEVSGQWSIVIGEEKEEAAASS